MGYKINNYGQAGYSDALNLHKLACLPLENDKKEHIENTVIFLSRFLKNELSDYATQRKTEHLARPDLIVETLKEVMTL
jgi:hypothetical protein